MWAALDSGCWSKNEATLSQKWTFSQWPGLPVEWRLRKLDLRLHRWLKWGGGGLGFIQTNNNKSALWVKTQHVPVHHHKLSLFGIIQPRLLNSSISLNMAGATLASRTQTAATLGRLHATWGPRQQQPHYLADKMCPTPAARTDYTLWHRWWNGVDAGF